MVSFLAKYIKNDQVGIIANAHLAHADIDSVFSNKCIEIAKKFHIAVDFAKNGKSAHLERFEKPQKFPDFMEKSHKETYKSKKALGKMFRVCKDLESENENASIDYHDIKEEMKSVKEELKAGQEMMEAGQASVKAEMQKSVKDEMKVVQEKMEAAQEKIEAGQEEMKREITCIIENNSGAAKEVDT
ncbi:RNA-dependent RNA polymerase 1, partial [Stegodyphus mimosarum]